MLKGQNVPGQTGHITGQMGRVPGTDGTHTRGCPAKILYVYWFFFVPKQGKKDKYGRNLPIFPFFCRNFGQILSDLCSYVALSVGVGVPGIFLSHYEGGLFIWRNL